MKTLDLIAHKIDAMTFAEFASLPRLARSGDLLPRLIGAAGTLETLAPHKTEVEEWQEWVAIVDAIRKGISLPMVRLFERHSPLQPALNEACRQQLTDLNHRLPFTEGLEPIDWFATILVEALCAAALIDLASAVHRGTPDNRSINDIFELLGVASHDRPTLTVVRHPHADDRPDRSK